MKKILLFLRDCVEIYLPVISFCVMFLAFILQVGSRYIFNRPLVMTNDFIVLGFCWTVILGACYTMRKHSHVQFTMLYDMYGPKVAAAARLLGNVIIIVTFAVLVKPSFDFAVMQDFQKTAVLRVSLMWVFMPFVYFLLSIIGYSISPCIEDIKVLTGKLDDSEDHKRDRESMAVTGKNKKEGGKA